MLNALNFFTTAKRVRRSSRCSPMIKGIVDYLSKFLYLAFEDQSDRTIVKNPFREMKYICKCISCIPYEINHHFSSSTINNAFKFPRKHTYLSFRQMSLRQSEITPSSLPPPPSSKFTRFEGRKGQRVNKGQSNNGGNNNVLPVQWCLSSDATRETFRDG